MNEITRIHLGRQPFVIAIDAHKQLRAYLEAIKKAVGGSHKEVLEEVELRMAELLMERGIKGDKAIVAEDVDYLQEQLGKPGDFQADESDEASAETPEVEATTKRLFRDTEHGMVAGVSSGLAAYFGVDAVIVRLLFVLTMLLGGWGILLYIVLWAIVPEAKSTSERLQMRGKAVTVDSLKEIVDQADVQGAAMRASKSIRPLFDIVGKIFLWCVASAFVLVGIGIFMAATILSLLGVLYQHDIFSEGKFVLSPRDLLFVGAAYLTVAITGIGLLLTGLSITNKKWRFPGWATATVISLFFISATLAGTLAPGVFSKMRYYAKSLNHTQTRQMVAFTDLEVLGDNGDGLGVTYEYVPSDKYQVVMSYMGTPAIEKVKTTVEGQKLLVDTRSFSNKIDCNWLCVIDSHRLLITVYAPRLQQITLKGQNNVLSITQPLTQPSMRIDTASNTWVSLNGTTADKVAVTSLSGSGRGPGQIELTGLSPAGTDNDIISVSGDSITLPHVKELQLTTNRVCSNNANNYTANPFVWIGALPDNGITVNDTKIADMQQLLALQTPGPATDNRYRCVGFLDQSRAY